MRTFLFHLLAFVMVVVYVNTFVLWREIGSLFGHAVRDGMPFIVVALLVIAIAVYALFSARCGRLSLDMRWLGAAVILAIIGLASTDPAFPAKRIHVPQYILLAIILSFALRASERTSATLVFVFLATTAFGVHDELLQGLHPRRTYGLRDMFVNMCGAGAGTLLVRAFTRGRHDLPRAAAFSVETPSVRHVFFLALASAIAGVALFAVAGTAYRADILPYWTVLPALAGAIALALAAERLSAGGDRAATRALVGICLLYAAYPVVINVAFLDFA